jgi:uncharacterized protein (DUF362 family)
MAGSLVVIVRGRGVRARKGDIVPAVLARIYDRGLKLLTGQADAAASLRALFTPTDKVGIKINTIAGRELTSPPDVTLPFARLLSRIGIADRSIVLWDRTNRELKAAGYVLNAAGAGLRILGTDTAGAGYGPEPVVHRSIASRFSSVLTDLVTASVSFAVLKDHGLAGVTAGMKNYFGAIHNPNKYHDDHGDPFVAELFDAPPVRTRHRLTILDALVVQCHRGPSYHAAWAEPVESLIFGTDPVAVDAVGWRLVERLRKAKGLPTLEEDGRPPLYIRTAERLGLGRAAESDIRLLEDEV